MIYEQINGAYQSLANQWQDLAESFRRLASLLPDESLTKEALLEKPIGLAYLCDHEADNDLGGFCQLASELGSRPDIDVDIQNAIEEAIAHFGIHEEHRTDIEGNFCKADYAGARMFPKLSDSAETVEVLDCRENLEHLRLYLANTMLSLQELISPKTTIPSSLGSIHRTVDNIASYPMLTSDLSSSPVYTLPPVAGGGNSLQNSVDNAVRVVLGHLPRAKDTRSFMLALNQAFQVTEVEGHTQVTWVQRSYTGQTDLGEGVTGGQASLYTRSKVALVHSLPLLEGLYPLLPDFDPQLVKAARSIVHSLLAEIVSELGIEGGPRIARVDQLFASLLEDQISNPGLPNQPSTITGGQLGYLKAVFGLTPDLVNTLEEEHNVTNFIALKDYVDSIQASWLNFRDKWLGKDLGTRLVQLSRTLSVAAETVDEVNFAMDSVFVGAAERQVVSFHDPNGHDVLIEELLSWISAFASEEAPSLVRDAGKHGAAAIIPTGQQLVHLVSSFIQQIPHNPQLPAGLRHPRVIPPLNELQTYLQRIVDLAQDINRPVSSS